MKLRQIIVMLGCLAAFYLGPASARKNPAADAPTPASTQVAQTAQKRGALFRVTQGKNTLYLFGTIHVGKPEFFPLEPQVLQAIGQASKIALEIDPANAAAMQQMMAQYGMLPAGTSLTLAPALQARLEAVLKKQGVPFSAIAQCKPWLVTVLLSLNEYSARGLQSSLGIDAHLSDLARAQKKPLVELESVRDQLALFGELPMADQIRFLDDTLADIEGPRAAQKINQLVNAWSVASIEGLNAVAQEVAEEDSFSGRFFREALLQGRNPRLANGIEKLLKSERHSFAGIGALHLLGPGSVPALLRQRGYVVERVY